MVAQSIPTSESQRRHPVINQNGYVLQKFSASFHGGVHDQSADRPFRSQEETGRAVDERNLGRKAVGEVKAFRVSSLSSAAEQRRFAMTIV